MPRLNRASTEAAQRTLANKHQIFAKLSEQYGTEKAALVCWKALPQKQRVVILSLSDETLDSVNDNHILTMLKKVFTL